MKRIKMQGRLLQENWKLRHSNDSVSYFLFIKILFSKIGIMIIPTFHRVALRIRKKKNICNPPA